ncbi:MAG: RNHCP domain-containing protein [Lachnospiraceae bacterium]|nr:RNHCP domain-containing protein [Lachnospiraceae bacterium]
MRKRIYCPNCLSSLHEDIELGDRESDCGVCLDRVLNVKIRKNQQMPYGHGNKENGTL